MLNKRLYVNLNPHNSLSKDNDGPFLKYMCCRPCNDGFLKASNYSHKDLECTFRRFLCKDK